MLDTGTVVGGRFEVGPVLGRGGMGEVRKAKDRQTGVDVAIKVMLATDAESKRRFVAEAKVLESLRHPNIVRYVAHGATEDGRLFLVMELLHGEDLAERLLRGPLSVREAIVLIRSVCGALSVAHRMGVVHRDLKPANLFLRGGRVEDLALLDFGIARRATATQATVTGALIGTPAYMAPEQAAGERTITGATDLFALGCIVFEALAGASPFAGEHIAAVLARVLFAEPPPLLSLRSDVPEGLAVLCAHLLNKDPLARPVSAEAVLDQVAGVSELQVAAATVDPQGLGRGELELVSVIVAAAPSTVHDNTISVSAARSGERARSALQAALAERGATVEHMADGTLVATLHRQGAGAVDQAVEATRCAWLVHQQWPEATVAVETARRVAGARLPLGEALDSACTTVLGPTSGGIFLGDLCARLVDGRVPVARLDGRAMLVEPPETLDVQRPLLGRPTPCVGRESELQGLAGLWEGALDDRQCVAALVVGAPGLGKSRLRHEFSRQFPPTGGVLRLESAGEALRTGTAFGAVGRALRRHFGLGLSGAGGADQDRRALRAAVESTVVGVRGREVAELFGEVCDLAFSDEDSVRLRAVRQDPRLLTAGITEALELWLEAVGTDGVLWIVDDAHWVDRPSLDLLGHVLKHLRGTALMVAAFARPEVWEHSPGLWKGQVQEMPLRPLGKRAAEKLARCVAGDRIDDAIIARIVEQSAGNALFLEELIRAACEGGSESVPQSVLAMLQSRIGRLGLGERRLLRAASVLGERFEAAGVLAVLGPGVQRQDTLRWTDALIADELLERERGATETLRFRHALVRDAAYGLLPEGERRLGHRLAARWLAAEQAEPGVIAEHLLRAGEDKEAVHWLLRAARRSNDREDWSAALRYVDAGVGAGAAGAERGALLALKGLACGLRGAWSEVIAAAEEAEPLVAAGTAEAFAVQRLLGQVDAYVRANGRLPARAESFLTLDPHPDARLHYADAAAHLASTAAQTGAPAVARRLLDRAVQVAGDEFSRYPGIEAWIRVIQNTVCRHTDDDLEGQIDGFVHALSLYDAAGSTSLMRVFAWGAGGEVLARAGQWEEAELWFTQAERWVSEGPLAAFVHATLARANAYISEQRWEDAKRAAALVLAVPGQSPGFYAMSHDVLSAAAVGMGDPSLAEAEARTAIDATPHAPVRRWRMHGHLADAMLAQGRDAEAWGVVDAALSEIDVDAQGGGYAFFDLCVTGASIARRTGREERSAGLRRRVEQWIDRQIRGLGRRGAVAAQRFEARVAVPARLRMGG